MPAFFPPRSYETWRYADGACPLHRDTVIYAYRDSVIADSLPSIYCESFPYLVGLNWSGYKFAIVSFRNLKMTGQPEADDPDARTRRATPVPGTAARPAPDRWTDLIHRFPRLDLDRQAKRRCSVVPSKRCSRSLSNVTQTWSPTPAGNSGLTVAIGSRLPECRGQKVTSPVGSMMWIAAAKHPPGTDHPARRWENAVSARCPPVGVPVRARC